LAFQKIPKWWVWYYWICPVAWTVYGLIVSQYRDVTVGISVPGETNKTAINKYIEDYYGFNPDFMGPVAAVLVSFAIFFAFIFAFCINQMKRKSQILESFTNESALCMCVYISIIGKYHSKLC
jgi:hypothetical protein